MTDKKSWSKALMSQGLHLITDPRVIKIMQDERVVKAITQVIKVPGKVQEFTQGNVEKVAKAMALATANEVKDLKRTVRRLEEEVTRLQRDRQEPKGS
jgi:hypothetical protein